MHDPIRDPIKAHLRAHGIRQRHLATTLGVTDKHMSQLLTGKIDGTVSMWVRIAAALGLCLEVVQVEDEDDSVAAEAVAIRYLGGPEWWERTPLGSRSLHRDMVRAVLRAAIAEGWTPPGEPHAQLPATPQSA